MARSSDPKKLALWQERFQRFLSSDLAVARFCVMEHVSVASFYHWRKKIGGQSVHKIGRRALRPVGSAQDRNAFPAFRSVTVVPAACGVSIRLPGGTLIEVGATHLDAIRTVVAETVLADTALAKVETLRAETVRTEALRATEPTDQNSAVDRNVSPDNQVIRQRSTVRKRGSIGQRGGNARTLGGSASC